MDLRVARFAPLNITCYSKVALGSCYGEDYQGYRRGNMVLITILLNLFLQKGHGPLKLGSRLGLQPPFVSQAGYKAH